MMLLKVWILTTIFWFLNVTLLGLTSKFLEIFLKFFGYLWVDHKPPEIDTLATPSLYPKEYLVLINLVPIKLVW